jgi:hypothetical protein
MEDRPTRIVDPAEGVDAIDDAALRAAHRVEVAVEWIERSFGALLDAHHAAGHAQEMLIDAARLLREAGRADLADAVLAEAACKDAAEGRWTYQIVDEFRGHLLDPARRLDERVRAELTGGVRHRHEARMKRDTPGASPSTAVRLPAE